MVVHARWERLWEKYLLLYFFICFICFKDIEEPVCCNIVSLLFVLTISLETLFGFPCI